MYYYFNILTAKKSDVVILYYFKSKWITSMDNKRLNIRRKLHSISAILSELFDGCGLKTMVCIWRLCLKRCAKKIIEINFIMLKIYVRIQLVRGLQPLRSFHYLYWSSCHFGLINLYGLSKVKAIHVKRYK